MIELMDNTNSIVASQLKTDSCCYICPLYFRYMNAAKGKYKGAFQCAQETILKEGMSALYRGFTVSCMRLVSWNIVLWLSYEQLKIAAAAYKHGN